MNNIEELLKKLEKSKFRNSFKLKEKELNYIKEKGMDKIKQHAFDFASKRLYQKLPNDGKQTPMNGHPVFIVQHATATCCRQCLYKWHNIPQNICLNNNQIDYIIKVIMRWIEKEMSK